MGEWVNNTWNIHTQDTYSIIPRKELLRNARKWNNLTEIILSKKGWSQESAHLRIPEESKNASIMPADQWLRAVWVGMGERTAGWRKGTFWGDGYIQSSMLLRLYT